MKKTFLVVAIVAMGLAASVPYTNAQDQGQATQGERPGRGRGFGGPMGRGGHMGAPMGGDMALRGIMRDLTDAQRTQVKAIHDKHAEQIRPLVERVRTARQALETAVVAGNTANLQALSIEVGNAETELTFALAQVQVEVFKLLTPEQKQTLAERRKQMEERRQEMIKRRQEKTQ